MATVYKSLSKANGSKNESPSTSNGPRKNKQRVLALSSRGVTYRHRHLLNDLANMMPHGRKDAKFDSKSKLYQLNELAELYNCNNVLFFEARKGKDLYLWLSKVPNGPTTKLHVQNMHTTDELNFTGNCLKGSRPILSFDAAFEKEPHLQLIKEQLAQCFGVPQGARKSKPFVDRVMGFTVADGKIWVRNYEIKETDKSKADEEEGSDSDEKPKSKSKSSGTRSKDSTVSLIEIGPRFVMTPIIIQEGSFGGPIIYENRQFVSPNQVRADLRRTKAARHNVRMEQQTERIAKKDQLGLRTDSKRLGVGDALATKAVFA